jgi:hypothetical protein
MKPTRAAAALLSLLLFSAVSLSDLQALEVESGRVRLVLHEGTGRYSLYIRSPEAPDELVPLFVDRDPRTSWLSVVVGGRVFRLGEGGEFRESAAARTPGGARFEWQSRSLRITQAFDFVTPSGGAAATGVRMTITLTNIGSTPLSVGLRDCLDTYLGEDGQAHFQTQPGGAITAEATVGADKMIRYWLSEGKKPAGVGLQRVVSGPGITSPDRIVFANWKRLAEVSWAYDTSIGRSFNLLPYSINDSAVCQYYEPASIAPGSSRTIVSVRLPAVPPHRQPQRGGRLPAHRRRLRPRVPPRAPSRPPVLRSGKPSRASTTCFCASIKRSPPASP